MSNITITDIAELAGVSKATVSRVLNHPEIVDSDTRMAVQRVMKENNYKPSITARNLSKRKSSMVGVILPQVDNLFYGEMLRGIIHAADKNELTVMCFDSDGNAGKDIQTLELLAHHKISGLLYVPATSYEEKKARKVLLQCLNTLDAPTVVVERDINLSFDGVFFDDSMAVYQVVTTMINAGHTRIAILNGEKKNVLTKERHKGFSTAISEAGVDIPEAYIKYEEGGIQSAYWAAKELLQEQEQPTVVITCGYSATQGFLEAVYECGKSIPRDYHCVSLDKIPMLNILGIPYNYTERDAYQMGKKAMEQLINRIAFPDKAYRHTIIETPLITKTI